VGSLIKAVHVTELRTAVAGVLSAIGVTPSYTDPTIVAGTTVVKGAHIQDDHEIRVKRRPFSALASSSRETELTRRREDAKENRTFAGAIV
jgi:outer membrane scaffolding protein for murein synthesis (MipA/OmpV family)